LKSSSGQYFQSLDHVRALAVFTVFVWHFNHFNDGQLAYPLIFPFSFFTEGHTGVAIFLTLSGYLFAKLLNGRKIHYVFFLWNRFLRIAPLLFLVLLIIAVDQLYKGILTFSYFKSILQGVLLPTLPHGAWSITVESHFYVILPLLLFVSNRFKFGLIAFLIIPLFVRYGLYSSRGSVQLLAFGTIIGRIDQFVLGIIAFQSRQLFSGRHYLALSIALLFLIFWQYFDFNGGFYKSPWSPIWIFLPTVEGFAYATLIAWYDNSFKRSSRRVSDFIALIGTYSYSIYMLHFFIVFRLPWMIDRYLFDLSDPYLLILISVPCFLLMMPIAYLSYRFIEEPFLRYRIKYLR